MNSQSCRRTVPLQLYAFCCFCVCKETAKAMVTGDIWFRFKEGYLNAVRKTVRIQDLMS